MISVTSETRMTFFNHVDLAYPTMRRRARAIFYSKKILDVIYTELKLFL